MSRHFRLATLAGLTALAACKPPAKAGVVKTLDNFAAQKTVRWNTCEADPAQKTPPSPAAAVIRIDAEQAASAPDVVPALRRTLTAIPADVQQYFVDKFRGEIQVTAEANALCSQKFATPGTPEFLPDAERKNIAGCFIETEHAENGQRPKVVIYVAPKAEMVQHNLTRVFGWLFTSVYAKRLPDGSQAEAESAAFRTFMNGVTQNFLRDMLDKHVYSLANIEAIIGKGQAAVVEANLRAGKEDLLDGVAFQYATDTQKPTPEQRKVRVKRLASWLFSEAYDSYFCRPFSDKGEDNDRKALDGLLALAKSNGKDSEGLNFVRQREQTMQNVSNTRVIMEKIFPRTYCYFELEGLPSFSDLVTGGGGPQHLSEACAGVAQRRIAAAKGAGLKLTDYQADNAKSGLHLVDLESILAQLAGSGDLASLFNQLKPLLAQLQGGTTGGGGGTTGGGGRSQPDSGGTMPNDGGGCGPGG